MAEVITCDRCKRVIEGARRGDIFTCGFYDVRVTPGGAGWERYANAGERDICDACMHADPRYLADYGTTLAIVRG